MANSQYSYVRSFESSDRLLPGCWILIRLDGRSFHQFSTVHNFAKPNDRNALDLMNRCASAVMKEFPDIVLSYGESDEYSFIFHPLTELFQRRSSKLISSIASLFSSSYVYYWSHYFPSQALKYPPQFDSRAVLYPSDAIVRDYLSWRQVDCHINNLYNTCFWCLVLKQGISTSEAAKVLLPTDSARKNELLFQQFGINYNQEPEMFKKGSIIIWEWESEEEKKQREQEQEQEKEQESAGESETEGENKQENNDSKQGQSKQPQSNQADASGHTSEQSSSSGASSSSGVSPAARRSASPRRVLRIVHEDLISDDFWVRHSGIIPYENPIHRFRKDEKHKKKMAYKARQQMEKEKEKQKLNANPTGDMDNVQ